MSDITILTPSKITSPGMFSYFKQSITTYYSSIDKPYPLHLIKDDSGSVYRQQIKKLMDTVGANYKFLEGEANLLKAFSLLLGSIETKYFMFMLGDVVVCRKKDFISPIIDVMEKNDKLMQVTFGGGIVSMGKDNRNNFIVDKDSATFRRNPLCILKPINSSSGDTVWCVSLDNKKMRYIFPFAYYNCIMRTDVFKRMDNIIKSKLTPKDKTMSHYCAVINYGVDTNEGIYNKGWPKGFEFLTDYMYGFLNLASYTFALGRLNAGGIKLDIFSKTHVNEIKWEKP